jgi:hypothetical protein
MVVYFTSTVFQAAAQCAPQWFAVPRLTPSSWWTVECSYAIGSRRPDLKQFQAHPTLDNLISFKRSSARAQQVFREAVQTSKKAFISSLSRSTRPDVVWYKLRRMSGKYSRTSYPVCLLAVPFSRPKQT